MSEPTPIEDAPNYRNGGIILPDRPDIVVPVDRPLSRVERSSLWFLVDTIWALALGVLGIALILAATLAMLVAWDAVAGYNPLTN